MSTAIESRSVEDLALANRGILNLKQATHYLVGRVRARTPIGAVDYLNITARGGADMYDVRVGLAIEVMDLYRETFPVQYNASLSPAFSTEREREFYALVDRHLFRLELDETTDPSHFYPFIPITGWQQHDWMNGCCPFSKLQLIYRLALVLSGDERHRWRELGLSEIPAEPLAAYGWTAFRYACAVEESPLREFPLVFHMTTYRTGNIWLDIPRDTLCTRIQWCAENMARLLLASQQASEIDARLIALEEWLQERPAERIAQAVKLWNDAKRQEIAEGYEDRMVDERGRLLQ